MKFVAMLKPSSPQKIIITGAPGTGKTSIIKELKERGFKCYDEVARTVIKEEIDKSEFLPWMDVIGFSKKVIAASQLNINDSMAHSTSFFDRGLPDTVAYLRVSNINHDLGIGDLLPSINYCRKVFITPFWADIYTNDNERRESEAQAKKIEEALISTYQDYGFEIVNIEIGSVVARTQFVLDVLSESEILV